MSSLVGIAALLVMGSAQSHPESQLTSAHQVAQEQSPPEGRAPVEQVPRSSQASSQVSDTSQLNQERRTVRPTTQLSAPADRGTPVQVYRGGRSAAPAEPLSKRSDSRPTATATIEGRDACDPENSTKAAKQPANCAHVIETRSEEFRQVERTLSPEERLLIEQRSRERGNAITARRMATGSVNPDSPEDQAIAAIALDQASPPPEAPKPEPKPEVPPQTEALINAIVNSLQPQN